MTSANKKNLIISAWEEILALRSGNSAIFAVTGKELRTFAGIEASSRLLEEKLAIFTPGDVVSFQIGNSPDWPALLLAAMRYGVVPLPIGRHVEKAELETVFKTCRVSGSVGTSLCGELEFQLLPGNRVGGNPDCDLLKLTCGNSSFPRAIRFHSGQLIADCDNICDAMGITTGDLNFGVIPISHSYGFSNLLLPLLCRGVPLVVSEDRMPRAILSDLARTGATVFPGMPLFYQSFAEMENIPELPRLRLWISAGAPLSRLTAEKFSRKFGLKIHSFYGASECGGIGYDAADSLDYVDSSLGSTLQNVQVIPLDSVPVRNTASHGANGGNRQQAGRLSLIEVRSAAVGSGYFPVEDPGKLAAGRFIPSDIIEQTPQGMRLAGTVSDIINIAGRKLNPLEVEALLLRVPGVEQAVVFGIPSQLRNEEVVACIAGSATMSEVVQQAQSLLGAWQMPRDFWLVDAIPRGNNGTIDRRTLAQTYLNHRKCRIS